ncbi:Tuberculostearic acid methyltransferase UfaA1 [Baekduia alba]|uniref:SAM-dependent methyltransferase n=1 Tax=Baekduia alba TaxID=2997333 RepID=UPI0023405695|nr:cyclopropane-fatty-acyl-phospholipid synthase family protein [Baekduia alba]WCB94713.1 Tuberculostearic acid methyltransferase UfaA1 [Baekduia alba]
MTDRLARRIALSVLRRIDVGRLTVVEDGQRLTFGRGAPEATVRVHDPRAWSKLLLGSRGMAEAYRDGLWDSPDLAAVIRVAARNATGLDAVRRRATPIREPFQRARAAFRRNTPRRARKDIEAHYDLGNELFGLMLDPTMMYSSAVFAHPQMTLQEASVAKLDRICDKLDLGPDDRVLEIGTGWGGFAVHAAATRGCHVTTTTISREQHDHAVARVRERGLEDRVTVLLDDYRDLDGQYDKLVSIEMIEAVGWKDFDTFFAVCSDRLAPDGAMLLQAIVMDDRAYKVERASRSFIRTLIFPNGCLPSREVIARCVARDTDLHAVHLEDLTPHYAETLHRWRVNFDGATSELEALGYDERFRRLWRLYLAYCEAGFAERRIGLIQTVLAKPHWRPEPAVPAPAALEAVTA